ncbi:MAG: SDR family NAD(P)-dependent oxidoreductase [Oscillospiraceae bacterium]|jgi:NADP-dependent 3-hydroxy acid dehydrogenase YdfG|nr:SDR family NAD(P)-dependent oxidoreductase [Oscillospiraceae bacterium]
MALKELKGKTAFVTGAASGIGQGIARACGNAGMNVILVDLRAKALDEAAVWFAEKGYPHHTIELDVTDRAAYAKAADNAEAKFGKVHLLVNNAGVEVPMVPLWKSTYDDIDFITGVNIHGVLNGIVTFVPRMLNYGEAAHVVNTSSQSGLSVVPGATLYNLTKAAVAAMTETLKGDLKGTNVDASVFAPGPVEGNLSKTSYEVRPASLGNKAEVPAFAPPPPPAEVSPTAGFTPQPTLDFSKATITALEAGERVLNGVQRGDLYIFTHPEFAPGIKNKYEAMLRAYPAETKIDPVRTQIFEGFFSFLTQNPVYAEQKPVPGFYK